MKDLHLALLGQQVEDGLAGVGIVRGDEFVGVLGQTVHVLVELSVTWNQVTIVSSTWDLVASPFGSI